MSLYILSITSAPTRFKLGFHTGSRKKLITRYRTPVPDHVVELLISHPFAREIEGTLHDLLRASNVKCVRIGETDNYSEWYEDIKLSLLKDLVFKSIDSFDKLRSETVEMMTSSGHISLNNTGNIEKFRVYVPQISKIDRVAVIDGVRGIYIREDPPKSSWTKANSKDEMIGLCRKHLNMRSLKQLSDHSIGLWNSLPPTLRTEWDLVIRDNFEFDEEKVIVGLATILMDITVEEFVSLNTLDPLSRLQFSYQEDPSKVFLFIREKDSTISVRERSVDDLIFEDAHVVSRSSTALRRISAVRGALPSTDLDPRFIEFARNAFIEKPCVLRIEDPSELSPYELLYMLFKITGRNVTHLLQDGSSTLRDVEKNEHSLVVCESKGKRLQTALSKRENVSVLYVECEKGSRMKNLEKCSEDDVIAFALYVSSARGSSSASEPSRSTED